MPIRTMMNKQQGGLANELLITLAIDGSYLSRDRLFRHVTPTPLPVEVVEIRDDDWNRKRYCQDAGDDAERADELPPDTDGRDVPVPDRSHCHDRPPERAGDRLDLRSLLARLRVVHHRTEDDHRYQQEEEEHPELVQTGFYCHSENTQTLPQS